MAQEHYTAKILLERKIDPMNDQTVELFSETVVDSTITVLEEKKTWLKPALERFDIGSVTQNAGSPPYEDDQEAWAQS